MSKIGFPEKVLEKRKICDYPLFEKVEQNFDNFAFYPRSFSEARKSEQKIHKNNKFPKGLKETSSEFILYFA
jgi:hypothetical protein